MGYRTRYALRTVNPADDAHIRASILTLYHTNPFCADASWGGSNECKWYEAREHCRRVSIGNLSKAFIIYGCGEDDSDAWELRCDGGRCTEIKVSWDELDKMMIAECELREARS